VLLDSDKSAMQEGPILPPLVTPEEARSGVMRSETMQRVASVIAVDRKRRQATLKLEDGASKTFPIRKDVEPRRIKKGEEVLIQTSSQVVLASAQP
jgi:hypothetical protein